MEIKSGKAESLDRAKRKSNAEKQKVGSLERAKQKSNSRKQKAENGGQMTYGGARL